VKTGESDTDEGRAVRQPQFFDIDRRLESISRMGNRSVKTGGRGDSVGTVPPLLEQAHKKERKSAAGRKPLDVVLMVIQRRLYDPADEVVKYQGRDRVAFMRLLGLERPDGTTIFGFRLNSMSMRGKLIRTSGKARAEIKIGCMNLTYNLMLYLQITKPTVATPALACTKVQAAETATLAAEAGRIRLLPGAITHTARSNGRLWPSRTLARSAWAQCIAKRDCSRRRYDFRFPEMLVRSFFISYCSRAPMRGRAITRQRRYRVH
jgi:hypothetical protein